MADVYNDRIFTYALTNSNGDGGTGTLTISGDSGIKMIAIQGTSATAATITGGAKVNNLDSIALTVSSSKSAITFCATPGSVINNLVITCPAGATCDIIANI